jgi:molybdenum cofactor cytidylyltransferase
MEMKTLSLDRALRLEPDGKGNWPCVALVGAGGKTTALFQLAHHLARRASAALVTTTTHLGVDQAQYAERSWRISTANELETALEQNVAGQVALITGPASQDKPRLMGLPGELLHRLWEAAQERHIPLLIEADGAACKPLKAPAPYEPVIPDCTDLVIVCAGLSGLGQLLEDRIVHRPQIFSELTGLKPGEVITTQALACLLAHSEGGLRNILPSMRRVLLLNQADSNYLEAQACAIAEQVSGEYSTALITSLKSQKVLRVCEPSAAIILAAGGALRFGGPKQLLEIDGQPMVRRSARLALAAGLAPVIVVCGAYLSQVKQALTGLPVNCVENPDWQEGQSTSLRAGLQNLPEETSGAVFLLADQPFLSLDIILALVREHAQTLAPIVAPRVGDQRANPVYFDKVTFPDLLALEGDIGGRAVIQSGRYRVSWLEWLDAKLLEDIDTLEDYNTLLHSA